MDQIKMEKISPEKEKELIETIKNVTILLETLMKKDPDLSLGHWMMVFLNQSARMASFANMSFKDFEALILDFLEHFRSRWDEMNENPDHV